MEDYSLRLIEWVINDLTTFFMELGTYLFTPFGEIVSSFVPNVSLPSALVDFLNQFSLIGVFSISAFFILVTWKLIDLFTPN